METLYVVHAVRAVRAVHVVYCSPCKNKWIWKSVKPQKNYSFHSFDSSDALFYVALFSMNYCDKTIESKELKEGPFFWWDSKFPNCFHSQYLHLTEVLFSQHCSSINPQFSIFLFSTSKHDILQKKFNPLTRGRNEILYFDFVGNQS